MACDVSEKEITNENLPIASEGPFGRLTADIAAPFWNQDKNICMF